MLLVDGEPVPYALARIPSAADNRGNLAAGARAWAVRSTSATAGCASRSGRHCALPACCSSGLDVIGGYVTEINVTSPTGVRELDRQFHLDIGDLLIAAIERRLRAARGALAAILAADRLQLKRGRTVPPLARGRAPRCASG